MKTCSWSRRAFRKLAGAGAVLVGVSLALMSPAMAQLTNAPETNLPDNDIQAKARAGLHRTESELDAGQTNAATATSAPPAPVAGATNSPVKPAADSVIEADLPELNNWVELGVGGSIVNGDKAQYQRQSGLPANTAFGGIRSFHFEEPISKKGIFSIDGRGIFDNHDYDLKLEVQHPDIGYVTAGLRQYREYYDGNSGYLPSNGLSFPPPNSILFLDRGAAFFETGLTLPNWPVIKLRYEHDYRSGSKDSTEWGTTTLTPGAVQKKITPAFDLLNEKTDFIALDLTHTIKATDFGVGLRYDWVRNTDSKNVLFFPGQGTQTHTLNQTDGDSENMINAHAFTDTRLNDQLEFSTGYSYTSLRDKIFGSRLDTPATTTAADTRYANLAGTSDLQQYELDLSLMWSPVESLYIVPAFRVEKEDVNGSSSDNAVAGNNVIGALASFQDYDARLELAESLDIRYTGITNWVFYVRGEWEEDRSDLKLVTLPVTQINNIWYQMGQKYSIGANWYPERGLNFAAQYYHKIDDNDYHNTTTAPTAYPAFISRENFNVDDVNFRVTWRPCLQLTLVSRYDFQYSTVDMQGFGLGLIQSGNNTTHMIGETISWSPLNRLYLQLGGNYVLDTTHTPTEGQTAGAVQESKNNYWTANATIGYALNDKTDVRASYVYYRSADYANNSTIGLPYGAGGEEHTATAALQRKINRRMTCTLKYSFAKYQDDLFGGNLNFTSHTILSSLLFRF